MKKDDDSQIEGISDEQCNRYHMNRMHNIFMANNALQAPASTIKKCITYHRPIQIRKMKTTWSEKP